MATYAVDKVASHKDIETLLDTALLSADYPSPENIDCVELKEYDRQTRQVFLWVSSLFTVEEEKALELFFRKNLHPRSLIAYCRHDFRFGVTHELS